MSPAKPCDLELRLLSGHETCLRCGHPAVDHRNHRDYRMEQHVVSRALLEDERDSLIEELQATAERQRAHIVELNAKLEASTRAEARSRDYVRLLESRIEQAQAALRGRST